MCVFKRDITHTQYIPLSCGLVRILWGDHRFIIFGFQFVCQLNGTQFKKLPAERASLYVSDKIISKNRIDVIGIIDFSLTVKAATLIFIPGRGSAISSARFYK